MMDTLCKPQLIDTGLKTPFQEVFDFQGKHIIELHPGFVQHADPDKPTDQSIAFEQTPRILFVESQEMSVMLLAQID